MGMASCIVIEMFGQERHPIGFDICQAPGLEFSQQCMEEKYFVAFFLLKRLPDEIIKISFFQGPHLAQYACDFGACLWVDCKSQPQPSLNLFASRNIYGESSVFQDIKHRFS